MVPWKPFSSGENCYHHNTYDCGVMAIFKQQRSIVDDQKCNIDYYGMIQEIIEVNYRVFSLFLLDVKWFKVIDTGQKPTICYDQCGFYAINSKAIQKNKLDTLVFPHQCEQVTNLLIKFYPQSCVHHVLIINVILCFFIIGSFSLYTSHFCVVVCNSNGISITTNI